MNGNRLTRARQITALRAWDYAKGRAGNPQCPIAPAS